MSDLQTLETMLTGLEGKGKELADKRDLFIESKGLDKSIKRNQKEKSELEDKLAILKADLKKLKKDKKNGINAASEKICARLNEFLPIGEAFFDASGAFSIGWVYESIKYPYNSLSGGMKSIFDAALENLLGSNIMIVEAAEMDNEHLTVMLEDLGKVDKQVFVNTWFKDFVKPDAFELVEV